MINYYGLLILVWIGYIASLLVTLESQFNATPLMEQTSPQGWLLNAGNTHMAGFP